MGRGGGGSWVGGVFNVPPRPPTPARPAAEEQAGGQTDVWLRQSSSGRSAAAAQQKSNTCNPYLTTDASMATNVED